LGQIVAVREVFAEIKATGIPEIIVINKSDIADPDVIAGVLTKEPHAVVVSAHTGEGFDELLSAIESDLPRPVAVIDVVLPYERGDLLNQIHTHGEIESLEHTGDGTHVVARVSEELASQVAAYA
ncbi:MAG: GTPase HflX, partial [Aeromicrobium sp.]